MSVATTKMERIHSLDALRSIMMMLGLVLHSTETYLVSENYPFPKDVLATSIFLEFIENFIHVFRMPIFFFMAGFFGALLFYSKGPKPMLKNRLSRIGLPFIVFLIILSPIIVGSLNYSYIKFSNSSTFLSEILANQNGILMLVPRYTFHLWFLYYLMMFSLLAFSSALLMKRAKRLSRYVVNVFVFVFKRPLFRVFFFSIIHFLILVSIWDLGGGTPLGFVPKAKPFLFYSYFYFVGWVLFKAKDHIKILPKGAHLSVIIGVLLFILRFIYSDYLDDVIKGVLHAIITWTLLFGLSGLFVKYLSVNSPTLRYVSDASYWVYLVHLPFTIWIPGLLSNLELPGIIKFFITLILTSIICFTTYHHLVRATFVGKFLNGRKYPIGISIKK